MARIKMLMDEKGRTYAEVDGVCRELDKVAEQMTAGIERIREDLKIRREANVGNVPGTENQGDPGRGPEETQG